MATIPFQLLNNYVASGTVSAKDLDRRANINMAQLGGLLRVVGAGVSYADPYGVNSLLVTDLSGNNVTVTEGAGFIQDSFGNIFAFEMPSPQTLTLTTDDPLYIHAQYISPASDVADPTTIAVDDTDTTRKITIVVDTSDTLANSLLLAEITAGAIVDLRVPVRWDNVTAQVAELIAWLGYNAGIFTTKQDVETRLAALEGGSGSGSGENSGYLSQLLISPTDTRNAATVLLGLETSLNSLSTGGTRPVTTDTDQLTVELAIARQTTIELSPDNGERSRSANIEDAVDGVYGDGTNDHPNFLDYTTATENEDGEFEV